MSDYKPGDKFIIEIEAVLKDDWTTLYRIRGFNALVFDEVGLGKLAPMDSETINLIDKKSYNTGYNVGVSDGIYDERSRIKGKIDSLVDTLFD